MATRRVAVIGAGVVGACIAYYLSGERVDVVLVDAGEPGQLTTSASFAWVNASAKTGDPTYFDLNCAGLKEYERLLADVADSGWWNPTGHLRWDYQDEDALEQSVERLRALDYPIEVWDAERAQRLLEPHIHIRSPTGLTVLFPSEAWVEGPRMVLALVASVVQRGGIAAFGSALRAINVVGGAVTSIELAAGEEYPVDAVVNAAGTGASTVAALVRRALPMRAEPGLAVRIQTSQAQVSRVIHAPNVSIRPDGPGRMFLTTKSVESELAKVGNRATELAEDVRRLGARVVPELAGAPIADVRIGHRPVPMDGFPLIGQAAGIDGYYEAVTHSGITLGPIVARTLTDEILRGDVDPLVASFRASRLGSAGGLDELSAPPTL